MEKLTALLDIYTSLESLSAIVITDILNEGMFFDDKDLMRYIDIIVHDYFFDPEVQVNPIYEHYLSLLVEKIPHVNTVINLRVDDLKGRLITIHRGDNIEV